MTSFNRIQKFSYKSNVNDVVSLQEYILFEDERTNEKYLVFKFHNNLEQYLYELRFEISQFNSDGNLIEKTLLYYDQIKAGSFEDFVPNAKMKANKACESISIELKYAKFERVYWENNDFTPIKFTKDDFRATVNKKSTFKEYKDVKTKKDEISIKGKRKYKIKNITKINISKLPIVFSVIFTIILLGFTIATAVLHNIETYDFSIGEFDYRILNSSQVEITEYNDDETNVVIPLEIFEYKIVAIGEGAFENSDITSVKFQDSITISKNAFKNCKNLAKITGSEYVTKIYDAAFSGCKSLSSVSFKNVTNVGAEAFKDCTNLISASLPLATIGNSSFENTPIKTLIIVSTSSSKLIDIFGSNVQTVKTLNYLTIDKSYVPTGYLKGINYLTTFINKNKNATYAKDWK